MLSILANNDETKRCFTSVGNFIDRCSQQHLGIGTVSDAPLPPSRRANQIGNRRHTSLLSKREQIIHQIFVALSLGNPIPSGTLARQPPCSQIPGATELSENAVRIPRVGQEQIEDTRFSIGKGLCRESMVQRPTGIGSNLQDQPCEFGEPADIFTTDISTLKPIVDGLPGYAEQLRQLTLAETECVNDQRYLVYGWHRPEGSFLGRVQFQL